MAEAVEGKAPGVAGKGEASQREPPLKRRPQLKPDLRHRVPAINLRLKSSEDDSDSAADLPRFLAITPSRFERAANN